MPSDMLFSDPMTDFSPDMKKFMNIMRVTRKIDFVVEARG